MADGHDCGGMCAERLNAFLLGGHTAKAYKSLCYAIDQMCVKGVAFAIAQKMDLTRSCVDKDHEEYMWRFPLRVAIDSVARAACLKKYLHGTKDYADYIARSVQVIPMLIRAGASANAVSMPDSTLVFQRITMTALLKTELVPAAIEAYREVGVDVNAIPLIPWIQREIDLKIEGAPELLKRLQEMGVTYTEKKKRKPVVRSPTQKRAKQTTLSPTLALVAPKEKQQSLDKWMKKKAATSTVASQQSVQEATVIKSDPDEEECDTDAASMGDIDAVSIDSRVDIDYETAECLVGKEHVDVLFSKWVRNIGILEQRLGAADGGCGRKYTLKTIITGSGFGHGTFREIKEEAGFEEVCDEWCVSGPESHPFLKPLALYKQQHDQISEMHMYPAVFRACNQRHYDQPTDKWFLWWLLKADTLEQLDKRVVDTRPVVTYKDACIYARVSSTTFYTDTRERWMEEVGSRIGVVIAETPS